MRFNQPTTRNLETCIGEIQKRQKAAKYPMAYWHSSDTLPMISYEVVEGG